MLFSIIIPTCNRNDLLSLCLDGLNGDSLTNSIQYEVIVTDDSKTDAAKTLVNNRQNKSNISWIKGPQRGPAANRNNGAKHAKGNWLIFIDDDCIPNSDIVAAYQDGITKHPQVKVFEGCTVVDRDKERFNEEAPVNTTGGYLFSCNFAMSAEYFSSLKGFDEKFPYPAMEDSELAYRIKNDNVTPFFLNKAIVFHPWRLKKNSLRMTLKRFSSALYFVEKHPVERKNFGSIFYLRAFYHGVFYTIRNSIKYKFRGIGGQIVYDLLQIYFAIYMLFI